MLPDDLVQTRVARGRVIPRYLPRDSDEWQAVAEELLGVYRRAEGRMRGEIKVEIEAIFGEAVGPVHRGLAKMLEDRSDFEVVSQVDPPKLREQVFTAAAEYRRGLAEAHEQDRRLGFRRDVVLAALTDQLDLEPDQILGGLFADRDDENRLIRFHDLTAQRLLDRYNVGLAQAVLRHAVRIRVEVRHESPARYRQLFHQIKFHRLYYQVHGSMAEGYVFELDGPLSLFSKTRRYGLQMAFFLPAVLLCQEFLLEAELRWGPRKQPSRFRLSHEDDLRSHYRDAARSVPPEVEAFVARFRQIVDDWELHETTEILPLGPTGVWVPDFRFTHRITGLEVYLEVLGFWRRSSVQRLLEDLPRYGPKRYILAISEQNKVDEDALDGDLGPVVRFREIPNAREIANRLRGFLEAE